MVGVRPYELEPIRIPMCLDELDDITINHPFRDHRKEPFSHRHSQQWEHIRMAKGLPRHNFLAERLRGHNNHQLFDTDFGKPRVVTHTRDLVKIARRVYFQNLDCDLATLVLTHPHIGIPAAVQCFLRSVETKWDLEWARKQSAATTYLA